MLLRAVAAAARRPTGASATGCRSRRRRPERDRAGPARGAAQAGRRARHRRPGPVRAAGRADRLADWYRAADVTVVPSHNESFGLVALESQACGTPVVAAAVGGLPTAVRDGVSACWSTSRRPADFAAAIGRLVTAPGLRAEMAGAARRHAERFSWQRTAEGLLVAYREALADRGADRGADWAPAAGWAGCRPRWGDHDRHGGADAVELDEVIRSTLVDRELEHQRTGEGSYLVNLPGTHRLATTACWLVVGDHALLVEAFVMRHADENKAELYDFLLQRNSRMYGVAFSIDRDGDVYLVGRLPLAAVTPDELDRLLGAVLTYADENFDTMLRIGFGDSIRREWAWRVKRGESLANLRAFARFADPGRGL